jgi:dsDNA-specific endonuclease/ATPase MutS2
MSNYNDAADFIRRQAKLHEGFVTAAEMLERIGSVEQAAAEAQRAREIAEAAKGKAELELATLQTQIDYAKDAAAQILLDAGDSAKTQAADIIMQANQTAQNILAREKANAESVAEASKAERLKALDDLSLITSKAAALRAAAEASQAAVDAAQKEHDRLNAAIEALKSKFA